LEESVEDSRIIGLLKNDNVVFLVQLNRLQVRILGAVAKSVFG
jgi:hypothetical protein